MSETRKIKTGTLHRSATFERATVNQEARTVELAFSSEAPYERWFGIEILDHSPGACDLSRLGNIPLLLDHDPEDLIGTVEAASIGMDRTGRAVVRFSRSEDGEEAFQDVIDGIRKSVSVGYIVNKMVEDTPAQNGQPAVMRATSWTVLEISLVAIPADPTVGLGRSDVQNEHETEIEGEAIPAQPEAAPLETSQETKSMSTIETAAIETQFRADAEKAERARVNEIAGLGELHAKRGGEKLAMQFIREGKSADAFRSAILDLMASEQTETVTVDLTKREAKEYSYVRAISAALGRAEGQNVTGLEVEISQDIERNMPQNYKRNGGIFIPLQLQRVAISEALYNTSGKGASTVFTQAGEFIDMLRNQSVAVQLGARIMSGLTGPVSFPTQTAASTAYWMPENDGTDVTASNATLSSVSLTPKTLQATTAFSRQLMAQASLDVEQFIRADLASVHALAWDTAVMHGTNSNNQPAGIYAASNVNSVAMGGVPTFGKLVDMVTEVLKDNALAGSLAFATTPGMAGKLAQTLVASAAGSSMIWDGALNNGMMGGYKSVASNQVSATLGAGSEHGLIFGNWTDALIGMWGALEIVVDPYAKKKQGMIEVTSFQLCDVALRHPGSFCKATGATIA